MKKRLILGVALCGVIVLPVFKPPTIYAGVPIGLPAQEFTQIANYGQLAKQLFTQAQQLQQLFTQVQWLIYNSKNLAQHPFTSIMGDLSALNGVIVQSQGLAYGMGQIDQQFAKMYPNYDSRQDWFNSYSNWANNTNNTIRGALGSAGLQGQNFNSEQQVMQQIRMMSSTPMGQNQAAQLGAVISGEMVSQLTKLRQLQVADMQSKAAYTGYQMQQDQSKQQASNQTFTPNTWTADQRSW